MDEKYKVARSQLPQRTKFSSVETGESYLQTMSPQVKSAKEETVSCGRMWNSEQWEKEAVAKAGKSMPRKLCYITDLALVDR